MMFQPFIIAINKALVWLACECVGFVVFFNVLIANDKVIF